HYLIGNVFKPTIILTNPDIFYLIISLKYSKSAEIIASLQKITTIVLDEFHIYNGLELINILTILFLSEKMNIGKRKILLSATPDKNITNLLKALLSPEIIEADLDNNEVNSELYTVIHKVNISAEAVDKENKLDVITEFILKLQSKMRKNRKLNTKSNYVPTLIILNSVVEIIKLEEELLKNGFQQEEIVPIRGLMDKSERGIKDKTLVILGTSAIEIGIDFNCDYLIFEASDASSFLQRFGRVGRHKGGKAILLGDYRDTEVMNNDKKIGRREFTDLINNIFDLHSTFSWFVRTKMGLFVAYTIFKKFLDAVNRDYSLGNGKKEELSHILDGWFEEYGKVILEDDYEKLKKNLLGAKNLLRRQYYKWPKIFYKNLSFRNSIQSVEIYVKSEEQKGRNPMIKADALSILKYGNNIKWNEKENRLDVDNFSGRHKVSINLELLDYNDYGEMLHLDDNKFGDVKIKQNDHFTPLSYIVDLNKQVIIFLPKEIRNYAGFDWRFQPLWCDDRKSIAIIGGMALIAYELYAEKVHNVAAPEGTIIL
ncbi:MAG TPA: type I-D CRISPR-associated helicase Cas3', partial [Candidatus Atribacteria bacterium]|nr:type I-D CRISPR-associated helicase Cas3' [Candidatus Atribacteria bacterium]